MARVGSSVGITPTPLFWQFLVHVIHSVWFSGDAQLRNSLISLRFPILPALASSLILLKFPAAMRFIPFERKGKGPLAAVRLVLFGSISILPNGN